MLREIWRKISEKDSQVSPGNKLRRCFIYGISDAGISPNNHLSHLKYSDLDPESKLKKKD